MNLHVPRIVTIIEIVELFSSVNVEIPMSDSPVDGRHQQRIVGERVEAEIRDCLMSAILRFGRRRLQ